MNKILGGLAVVGALLGGCQIQENKDWNNPLDPAVGAAAFKASGMVYVPAAAQAVLGSTADEEGRDADESPHSVSLSAFLIDSTEVTQAAWIELMGKNPAHNVCLNCPVEQVSWFEAVRFCNQRSHRNGLDSAYSWTGIVTDPQGHDTLIAVVRNLSANGYRLPTEAEWEYAARGGLVGTTWGWGNDATQAEAHAWDSANGANTTHPVATRKPNALGLYDMAGNVWEWTNDWYAADRVVETENPVGPANGENRVVRGGAATESDGKLRFLRNANRFSFLGARQDALIGFRCVRPLVP